MAVSMVLVPYGAHTWPYQK